MAVDFDQALKELRAQYVASLPEQVRHIREALGTAKTDRVAAESAREVFHRLRGTGAQFGLPDVSAAGARGEAALIAMRKDAAADLWKEIEAALQTLETLTSS